MLVVSAGPDVQSQSSSELCASDGGGLSAEPEDQELYLMCLCEQQVLGGELKRKKGKETFIGFLVSYILVHVHVHVFQDLYTSVIGLICTCIVCYSSSCFSWTL